MNRIFLGALVAFPLAACNPPSNEQATTASNAIEMVGEHERAPLPQGDPNAPDIAADNCIAELANTANRPADEIRIAHIIANERVVVHYLELEGADALWSCRTDPAGTPLELSYTAEG